MTQYKESKENFKGYCYSQLESIKCAIEKKASGSPVENDYFLEHLEKLRSYFLTTYVDRPSWIKEGSHEN